MSKTIMEADKLEIKVDEKSSIGLIEKPDTGSKTVMRLENLTKKFGSFVAVDKINLEVYEGETIGLVGPNGAGKTTTIKMIAKLIRPTSGKIMVLNKAGKLQALNGNDKDLVKFGFLIDQPFFYDMTAFQILRYFARSQNYPKEKINARIDELLKLFKLINWKHEKVKTFSKGMRQKLGIIQSILVDPQIIILDEPQTGLDPKARIEIRATIRELQTLGKTIFVASHMLHEISEVCDKIALINNGKIVAFDTIENLEKNLKEKELHFQLLYPLPASDLENTLKRINEKLEHYANHAVEVATAEHNHSVQYNPHTQNFTLFYDGKKESRGEILEILMSEFRANNKIISFSQPKTSKLEQIYLEMILEDTPRDGGG
ncbi:MAG: ABC transporter ATP-binding protein [Promethearchaeota archaeon]